MLGYGDISQGGAIVARMSKTGIFRGAPNRDLNLDQSGFGIPPLACQWASTKSCKLLRSCCAIDFCPQASKQRPIASAVQGRSHLSWRSGFRIQGDPMGGEILGRERRRGFLRTMRRASDQEPSGTRRIRGWPPKEGCAEVEGPWISSPSGGNRSTTSSIIASFRKASTSSGARRFAFAKQRRTKLPVPLLRQISFRCCNKTREISLKMGERCLQMHLS